MLNYLTVINPAHRAAIPSVIFQVTVGPKTDLKKILPTRAVLALADLEGLRGLGINFVSTSGYFHDDEERLYDAVLGNRWLGWIDGLRSLNVTLMDGFGGSKMNVDMEGNLTKIGQMRDALRQVMVKGWADRESIEEDSDQVDE